MNATAERLQAIREKVLVDACIFDSDKDDIVRALDELLEARVEIEAWKSAAPWRTLIIADAVHGRLHDRGGAYFFTPEERARINALLPKKETSGRLPLPCSCGHKPSTVDGEPLCPKCGGLIPGRTISTGSVLLPEGSEK